MIEPLSLIVKEEEQLVLHYRAANCAAKHVPAEQWPVKRFAQPCINPFKSIFPLIRVQFVVAEVLPKISVETVGTGLDCGTDNATLEITEFSRGVASNQVEFLDGIRRRRIAQKIVRYLVIVHSIKEEVIGLLTIAVDVWPRPARGIVSIIKISGIRRN